MSSVPVRWGIVGTGRMADVFAREIQALAPEAALTAVASRDPHRARAFGSRFAIERAHARIQDIAEDENVDAVYIATPPSEHAEHARICVAARKAVLCEKPFTINALEAGALIALARRNSSFLMEAMWTRFLPCVTALRETLRQKTIGDVQLIVAGGGFIPACEPGNYLFSHALGGGALLDAGVYLVSLSSMALGRPTRVLASAAVGASGIDENDAIILEHAGGARALLYVSLRTRRPPDMEILGTHGRILLHGPIFKPDGYTVTHADGSQVRHDLPARGTGYGYQIAEVMNCLRAGRTESDIMPLEETLSIMQTMDNARRQFGLRFGADD